MDIEIVGMKIDLGHDDLADETITTIVKVKDYIYEFVEGKDSSLFLCKHGKKEGKELDNFMRRKNVSKNNIVLSYFNQKMFMYMYQWLCEEKKQEIFSSNPEFGH